VFDRSKPDGMPQKVLDVSRVLQLGWKPRVSLDQGIGFAYADFVARLGTPRRIEHAQSD
jgi:GDP-L-fucose synthase